MAGVAEEGGIRVETCVGGDTAGCHSGVVEVRVRNAHGLTATDHTLGCKGDVIAGHPHSLEARVKVIVQCLAIVE